MPARKRVSFAASAVADLGEILAYYTERQVPEVGARLIREIIEQVEAPEKHPDMASVNQHVR